MASNREHNRSGSHEQSVPLPRQVLAHRHDTADSSGEPVHIQLPKPLNSVHREINVDLKQEIYVIIQSITCIFLTSF